MITPQMSPQDLDDFLAREMPQVSDMVTTRSVNGATTIVDMKITERHLRPGGTVSGPSLFMLADVAFYLNVLSLIGPVALAVTTNANINFMRKPDPKGLFAVSTIIKLGKRLAVGDVMIYSTDDHARENPVAHASVTYAIPQTRAKS